MNLAGWIPRFILPLLLAMAASGIMFYMADGNLASGNMHNAVRNWEQYGLLTLKGKMVTNPGGYEALTKPQVYKGHRAASLYPVFLIKRLFVWTGAGTLAVHVVLSLTLLLSTWFLLGKSRHVWLTGVAAILCPGYIHDQTYLDPNVIALLLGLPFAAIILPLLARPALPPAALAALLLTIAVYTALNWTTAFVHGILLAYLVAARQISTRRVWLYAAAAGISLILVAGVSVLDKQRGYATFSDFLGHYLWGSAGYGAYLTTDRAVVRLLFVGGAGLLPLLLVYAYFLARRAKCKPQRPWIVYLPLGAAILGVFVMRNYFGTVPWMAAAAFLAALILSMRLVMEQQKETFAESELRAGGRLLMPVTFLAGCFVYASAVTILASLHDAEARSLVTMVRNHTARSDTIVLEDTDPKLTGMANGVADITDRRVVVLNSLPAGEHLGARAFLLSSSGEAKLPLVAATSQPALISWPLVRKLLACYSTKVARRLPGDQGLKPGTCYLYELSNGDRAADIQATPVRFGKPM
ncbi:MAG TPA: hypothetical protein P5205_15965 [Candidatus Paceibacterota bacterium]|nr:hypothetical protein [Verrucomicrobiota bacterium]HSA11857.1 hypothetical protein [Candidatus Paceibacterota bacterium]